ncbi:MAG: hypothetical protein K6C08_01055 [Oscillospiraceae bacterium]|nr:hypothetical protein [Oscillospiraceae bacterium]
MIKNNRPYTNENGYKDAELITDLNSVEMKAVQDWIRENVRPADTVYSRSSYGLKHVLEHDTGVYLTNNQFKDAMYLAGFMPEDANELNWQYRISMVKEQVFNPSPFVRWLKEKHLGKDTPIGDFAGDTVAERDFPVLASHDMIEQYLRFKHACDGAMAAFEEAWKEYVAEGQSAA